VASGGQIVRVVNSCLAGRFASNARGGLEPPRLAAQEPKSCALPTLSINTATGSRFQGTALAHHLPTDTCHLPTDRPPLAPPTDPDLALVVAAWPTMPEPIKVGIMAMVKAALGVAMDGREHSPNAR
jgi:hypothetical protein